MCIKGNSSKTFVGLRRINKIMSPVNDYWQLRIEIINNSHKRSPNKDGDHEFGRCSNPWNHDLPMFGRLWVHSCQVLTIYFFFVPHSRHIDQLTFHISLPNLKFTCPSLFTYHYSRCFWQCWSSSRMQDACHIWTQLNNLVLHEFSSLEFFKSQLYFLKTYFFICSLTGFHIKT